MNHSYVRITHLTEVDHKQPTYVAIGSFDGVHQGHQALLQAMVRQARAAGVRTAALTFFPHPRRVMQTLPPRFYIYTLEDRVRLLAGQGIDLIITHPFDDEVRRIRAADFVDQLIEALDMKQLWGGNFALGFQREGDVPFLRRQGEMKGFTVETLDKLVLWGGDVVSSRRIRQAMEDGDMATVNGCLGRLYCLRGRVIKGDQRGRMIGFPTANLALWDELLLPAYGVYATYAWVGDRRLPAATNVGVRPTVNGSGVTVEAHLLDFDEDIYGEEVRLEFVARIRPEMKFPGLDALKAQIRADVESVREEIKR
jgi:riboflavin kinase / FMN adenylyltransferase